MYQKGGAGKQGEKYHIVKVHTKGRRATGSLGGNNTNHRNSFEYEIPHESIWKKIVRLQDTAVVISM